MDTPFPASRPPRVSLVMANWQGGAHLPAAIASVRRQTMGDWALIVSDDGSTDDSAAIVRAAAATDPRIRLLTKPASTGPTSTGPAAARNRALAVATGDWIAVMDSDDLMHPTRLDRMLQAAHRLRADILADDMAFFGAAPGSGGKTLLQPLGLTAPLPITAERWIAAGGSGGGGSGGGALPPLGYLKPMIRRDCLGALRYDPALRVAEDFDLILRLLLRGAVFHALPDPMYLYRRHGASISHRLSVGVVAAMIAAQDALGPQPAPLAAALARRRHSLAQLAAYETLVAAIKARHWPRALALLARQPQLLARLWHSLHEGRARRRLAQGDGGDNGAATMDLILGADPDLPPSDGVFRVPAPPAAGLPWDSPPALMAAHLTALSERRQITPRPQDGAGDWAQWLIPGMSDRA